MHILPQEQGETFKQYAILSIFVQTQKAAP